MQQEWTIEDLIDRWTFTECDWALIANKTGATRLGFGLLLKFFELEARFPLDASEFPSEAVVYAASQLKVDPAALDEYAWTGRTIKGHRSQIRSGFGFREASVGDADKLAAWLAEEVCPVEFTDDLFVAGVGGLGSPASIYLAAAGLAGSRGRCRRGGGLEPQPADLARRLSDGSRQG